MYAKFRLHPPYGFLEEDFYCHMERRGQLNKHFCKKTQISPMRQKKMSFSSFPIMSMGTISCHSNQSSYPTGTKNTIIRSPDLLMLYVKYEKNRLQRRCRLKMLTDMMPVVFCPHWCTPLLTSTTYKCYM